MEQSNINGLIDDLKTRLNTEGNTSYESLSNQIYSTQNNSEKVKLAYNTIEEYKLFPRYENTVKSSEESEKYRSLGDEDYKNKKFASAMKMYNLSIMNAPSNTKELCLAYSNRSALNYALKNYSACLEDIERAMLLHCDSELREELLQRKMKCEKDTTISEVDNIDDLCKKQLQLTKDQNTTIPAASVSLELTYSEKMGRGLIATQDILPGEVLSLENPYSCIVFEPYYTEYCYGCLKHSDSMIPCPDCCSVMFCNEECRVKAFKDFHKIDCKLMHLMSAMKFGEVELMALRTVLQAKCTYGKCVFLKNAISEAESVNDPLLQGFTVDRSGKRILDSSHYSPIHIMKSNVEKFDASEIFEKCITASVFLNLLLNHTSFFDECGLDDNPDDTCFKEDCIVFYGGLLLHNIMTTAMNMHVIRAISENEYIRFGGGVYPFSCMSNHSCAPNMLRFNNGTSLVFVCLRPIKKGQEILDNYGYYYIPGDLDKRQRILMADFKFQCECEACVNKWPVGSDLPEAQITDDHTLELLSMNLLTEDLKTHLRNGDRSAALNIVNQLYPHVTALDKYAPCRELYDYQEIIRKCWSLFGNVAPLRYTTE